MASSAEPAPHLVHGMGRDPVEPDWAALTTAEVERVLRRVPELDDALRAAEIVWHSPRPFSAAALVRLGEGDRALLVKRHHVRVRNVGSLAEEHAFARWLGARGVPAAQPIGAPVAEGEYVYEVQCLAKGYDRYREALSWTPFASPGDAAAAGRALAELHCASAGYAAPARQEAPLVPSTYVIDSADPIAAIDGLAKRRPGIASYLYRRPWRRDLAERLGPLQAAYLPHGSQLERLFAHNDWHPSNLFWSAPWPARSRGGEGEGEGDGGITPIAVTGVIDFGLSNLTTACYDLATALERSVVGWLEPAPSRPVHLDQAAALLEGYSARRPLGPTESAALPHLLAIVHVDYALSEIEYFHDVVGSEDNADLAYDGYLLDHLDWFTSPAGQRLCHHLAERLGEIEAGSRRDAD